MADKPQPLAELSTLFPDKYVSVRVGRWGRRETLRLRPFSIRQLMDLRRGDVNVLALATGKDPAWFRRVHPDDLIALGKTVESINDWTPEKVAAELGSDAEGKPLTIGRCAAILIAAGHDASGIWDYPLAQFGFYVRESLAIQRNAEGVRAALAAEGTVSAICAALSKDGAELLRKFTAAVTKEV